MARILAFFAFAILIAGSAVWLLSPSSEKDAIRVLPDAPPELPKAPGLVVPPGSEGQKAAETILAPPARVPSGVKEGGLVDLEAESSGRWLFRKRADGTVAKMSEARFRPGGSTPTESARLFLDRFGKAVFGLPPSSTGPLEVIQEDESIQVIIPFVVNGLPVHNAQQKQFYDIDGNLVYVVSDSIPSDVPSPEPKVSREEAAGMAREGLLGHLGAEDRSSNEAAYPASQFLSDGRLTYRMLNGALSLVYRYELPLLAPAIGDMEIVVDAQHGGVVGVDNLTRK